MNRTIAHFAWLVVTCACVRSPPAPPERLREPETFPFECFRIAPEEASDSTKGYVCIERDRFVMWNDEMHESRFTTWERVNVDEWRGTSEGAFSPTLELRIVRAGDEARLSLGDDEVHLETLSSVARADVASARLELPSIETVCEASRRCFAAAVSLHARAQDGVVPGTIPEGRTVVECRMQRQGALALLPSGSELPEACIESDARDRETASEDVTQVRRAMRTER